VLAAKAPGATGGAGATTVGVRATSRSRVTTGNDLPRTLVSNNERRLLPTALDSIGTQLEGDSPPGPTCCGGECGTNCIISLCTGGGGEAGEKEACGDRGGDDTSPTERGLVDEPVELGVALLLLDERGLTGMAMAAVPCRGIGGELEREVASVGDEGRERGPAQTSSTVRRTFSVRWMPLMTRPEIGTTSRRRG